LLWSDIERAIQKEIRSSCGGQLPKKAHGIKAALNTWRDIEIGKLERSDFHKRIIFTLYAKLQDSLDMRNGFCHGCVGISLGKDGLTSIITWEFRGENHEINHDELLTILGWLSKITFAIEVVSAPRVLTVGCRLVDTYENREWWRTEFGL
jgi:hypothetical protein